ncbi:hypothetical protein [Methylobacterium sp. J-077]|uniref:hypothetical protein n=1 Tax=Methylobacterium sp. J-077 TaxID=2836656 RepID=UPI001FBBF481|nr:hypothetical protein [Methylobacterium sp. J-077]MCJ2125074.1 hypothetical protein [Methylobacterium sp. J-077]
MSQRPVFHPLADMEDDILAVGRWAGVLNHLGTGHSMIDPGELWVISHVLSELGKRLKADWNVALDVARAQR